MHDLPTLLRVQRAALRLSQERTALAANMTFYRYRRLEEGLQLPTVEEINAIAAVFVLDPKKITAAVKATAIGAHA
jgi:transcriptional regulator with XRE-family HTH domain